MRNLIIVASFLLMQGCAFSDAVLDVQQDPQMIATGALSEVGQTTFSISELTDDREDTARVGYKKNAYGMKTADINTSRPVTEIVAEALAQGLEGNGHIIGDGGIVVSGAVSRYWVDTDINFTNVEVFSDLDVHLVFTDPTTHEPIYDARYSGHGSEKKGMVTERVMREVLAAAVASLVEEIVLDEDLVDALRDYRQARR